MRKKLNMKLGKKMRKKMEKLKMWEISEALF